MRRLTRYRYNNVPTDAGGRYFYINDGGDVWTPAWLPVKAELDHFECPPRPGLHADHRRARRRSRAESLYFVPLGENAEVQKVTLTNTSDAAKSRDALLVRRVLPLERPGRPDELPAQLLDRRGRGRDRRPTVPRSTTRPSTASVATTTPSTRVNAPIAGFDTDRDTFVGPYNGLGEPRPCRAPAGPRTRSRRAGHPIGSHAWRSTSRRARTRTYIFVLGYVENPAGGEVGGRRPAGHQQEAGRTSCSPASRPPRRPTPPSTRCATTGPSCSRRTRCSSADEKLDRMVNIWNQYQCMVTFNMSRSASYFETGIGRGMGFRDSNQDLLGFVHLIPDAGPRAHPRHRRDPVPGRLRLPPVPAAHQARQQRRRLRLQRRPAVADRGRRGLHQGDGRLRDPRRAGAVRQRPEGPGRLALRAPDALVPLTSSTTSARTACR